MKFGTIVLTGISSNALPKMIGTIQKVFNAISGFFNRVFNFFKPFVSFVTGINFEDRESENKKLIDEADNLKKQLKPLDDITNKVGKLTGDFNKFAEKSGASTGGGGSGTSVRQHQVKAPQRLRQLLINRIHPPLLLERKQKKNLKRRDFIKKN